MGCRLLSLSRTRQEFNFLLQRKRAAEPLQRKVVVIKEWPLIGPRKGVPASASPGNQAARGAAAHLPTYGDITHQPPLPQTASSRGEA